MLKFISLHYNSNDTVRDGVGQERLSCLSKKDNINDNFMPEVGNIYILIYIYLNLQYILDQSTLNTVYHNTKRWYGQANNRMFIIIFRGYFVTKLDFDS